MQIKNNRVNHLEKLIDKRLKLSKNEELTISMVIDAFEDLKGLPHGSFSRTQKEANSKGYSGVLDELADSYGMTLPELSRWLRDIDELDNLAMVKEE